MGYLKFKLIIMVYRARKFSNVNNQWAYSTPAPAAKGSPSTRSNSILRLSSLAEVGSGLSGALLSSYLNLKGRFINPLKE